jgi:hypothetical protein
MEQTMTTIRSTMRALPALGFGMAAWACGTNDGDLDAQLGRVEVTLTAVDGEGNTWSLPAGTSLYVAKGNFQDTLPLDGDAPVATFSLPVGMFEWELTNPYVYGSEWSLQREDAQNNVETVLATLANPQPDTFLVEPSSTTSLSLQFDAALGGSVSFAKGTVDVDLAVTTTEETGGTFHWGGIVQASSVTNGSTAPAAVTSALPALGSSFELSLGGHVAGPWEMWSNEKVCAPVTIDVLGAPSPGVLDLVLEAIGDVGVGELICVHTSGVVEVFFHNEAAPGTSTFSGQGSTYMSFETLLVSDLAVPAFDGDTLDLALLSGTHSVSSTAYLGAFDLDAAQPWYSATANGQVTFALAPAAPSP